MNPESMTWGNASLGAEDVRRRLVRAGVARAARTGRHREEMALALLALVKTMLVMVALAVAVMVVGHSAFA
jgi:hypothetical protein